MRRGDSAIPAGFDACPVGLVPACEASPPTTKRLCPSFWTRPASGQRSLIRASSRRSSPSSDQTRSRSPCRSPHCSAADPLGRWKSAFAAIHPGDSRAGSSVPRSVAAFESKSLRSCTSLPRPRSPPGPRWRCAPNFENSRRERRGARARSAPCRRSLPEQFLPREPVFASRVRVGSSASPC